MKKLLAVLTVCTMLTCAFASCGNEKEESSESKKDISVSDSSEEDTTAEEVTKEETETTTETTEETTTETTTEEVTTTETTTETTTTSVDETEEENGESIEEDTKTDFESIINSEGVTDENILGMWFAEEDDVVMGFNFKEDGNADIFMDMSELIHFTSDGKLFMSDAVLESDYINYDGSTLAVTVNEQDAFTMTKESGSADSFDGVYAMKSGAIYDSLMASVDESTEIVVIVNGENFYSGYRNMFRYSANGEIVTMTGLETIGMENDGQSKYVVNGDSIVFHDFDGEEMEMKKLVF